MSELPAGWSHFSLRGLGGLSGGKTPSKANPAFWSSPDVPWVSPKDMKRDLLEDAEDRISQVAVDDAGMTLFPADSVLMVTRSGILQHTFPVALAVVELTVNQDIKVLRPIEGVAPKFSFYMLKSFGGEILSACSKDGTTVQSIDSEKLEAFEFPLPPFAEQTRIAAKLDELLAQVDTLKARIDGIPALLKRFRQSVLAAAVSGRLTEAWRERADTANQPYSAGYSMATLDSLASFQNGFAFKSEWFSKEGDVQVAKIGNVRNGKADLSNSPAFVSRKIASEYERFMTSEGDILLSMTGTKYKRDYGFACSAPTGILVNQRVGKLTPDKDKVDSRFFLLCLQSAGFREQFFVGETGQVSQGNVGSEHIKKCLMPAPSLSEQTEIVRRVEQLFAFADQLEARVKAAQSRINHLTQSILAKAFRGELVPQDPNDEPASVLLERIKTQRAAAPKAKRGRKAKETA